MALYFTATVAVRVSESSTSDRHFQDTNDVTTDTTALTETTGLNRKVVADGASDEALSFSGVASGSYFYFKSSQDVSIKLNGSSTALAVAKGKALYAPITVTSCTVTNGSGNDANIDYSVSG